MQASCNLAGLLSAYLNQPVPDVLVSVAFLSIPYSSVVLASSTIMKEGTPLQGDDAQLAALGHRPELKRRFSTW